MTQNHTLPLPLLYLQKAGSGGKQAAAKFFYQDEGGEILAKHCLAIND